MFYGLEWTASQPKMTDPSKFLRTIPHPSTDQVHLVGSAETERYKSRERFD